MLLAGGLVGGALTALAASVAGGGCCAGCFVLAGAASAAATPAGGRMVLAAFPPPPARARARRAADRHPARRADRDGGAALARPRRGLALGARRRGGADRRCSCCRCCGWSSSRTTRPPAAGPGRRPGRDRDVRLLTLWGSLIVVGQYSLLAFLALDIHDATGRSLASASVLVVVAQAAGIAGRLLWGALSDRGDRPRRKPMLLVLTSTGFVAALLLVAVPRSAPMSACCVAGRRSSPGSSLVGFQGLWVTMLAEFVAARTASGRRPASRSPSPSPRSR